MFENMSLHNKSLWSDGSSIFWCAARDNYELDWRKSMGVKVQIKVQAVTGRVRYYPVGENAKHVLALTRKKTLSEIDIEALKALGCEIEKVAEDEVPGKKRKSWW